MLLRLWRWPTGFAACLFSLSLLFGLQVSAQESLNTAAILHDSRSDLYRTPFGAVPFETNVTIRLRTAAGDVDAVTVRLYRTYNDQQILLPMTVVATTPDGYDYWEAVVETGRRPTLYYYRFLIEKAGQTVYYEDDTKPNGFDYVAALSGGPGAVYEQSPDLSFQISVYDPAFETPEWMRNATIYQIFPDRFRNADPTNDPADGDDVFYGDLDLIYHETWNEPPVDGRVTQTASGAPYFNSDFYGGDLAGVIEQLDYIQSLGVTAIYLNPIFEARSNHRYDTSDYMAIDPMLGDLETFRTLVAEADARGMKIILDGVFNHLSSDSLYFDRYNRFDTEGACESVDSPYRDWFVFSAPRASQPDACVDNPDGLTYYQSWAGFDSIPRLNSPTIDVRRFIFLDDDSIVRAWLREGIGGWRLDVANEIDDGTNPSELYWEAFRTVSRTEDPEAVVIGEYWDNASEWLLGDEWDSVMNYRFRRAIIGFVRGDDFTDNDGTIRGLTPSGFDAAVRSVEEDYPPAAYHALMNLVDSHDTTRIGYAVDNRDELQRLAALTLFTLPGAPTIYYGDEIAIDAPSVADAGGNIQDDPYNRAPYPWPDTEGDHYPAPDETMLTFYQQLGQLRRETPALRQGEMVTLAADDASGIYAFLRRDVISGSAAIVVINTSETDQTVGLNWAGLLPNDSELVALFEDSSAEIDGQEGIFTLPALSGNIWTLNGSADTLAPLTEVPTLTVSANDGAVTLEWASVSEATAYIIYRSPVASGGFEQIASVEEPTYTDTSTSNGYQYFYRVSAVRANGIEGPMSGEAGAVPAATIAATFYVGDSSSDAVPASYEPTTVGLEFGVTTEISAGIVIDNVTSAEGPAVGVRAEAALLPVDADISAAEWVPMSYVEDQNGADIYAATLAPQENGQFSQVVRFSVNAGQTWTIVTLRDDSFPQLIVEASNDLTAPPAPGALSIGRASVSGVVLTWESVTDDGLYGYRIYRTTEDGETTQIGEVTSDTTRFVDPSVVDGDTFVYGVSSIDRSLNESELTSAEAVTVTQQTVPVRFTVEVPAGTSGDVFIAGNFATGEYPTWDPAGVQMEQVDDTHWTVVLNLDENAAIEYKYVRGDWSRVEKGSECEEIANRRVSVRLGETDQLEVIDVVVNWVDLTC